MATSMKRASGSRQEPLRWIVRVILVILVIPESIVPDERRRAVYRLMYMYMYSASCKCVAPHADIKRLMQIYSASCRLLYMFSTGVAVRECRITGSLVGQDTTHASHDSAAHSLGHVRWEEEERERREIERRAWQEARERERQ
eukprot:1442622-Pyramimonas_sp.AAC.2